MSPVDLRAAVVAEAAKWNGTAESPPGSNSVVFNRWRYGNDTRAPWCANYVNYVLAHVLGMTLGGGPKGSAYTPALAADAKARGLWVPWDAPIKAGWGVLYYYPSMGRIAHTGITAAPAPAGADFKAWEGNTDARGGRTGGRVLLQPRSRATVGRPGGFVNLDPFYGATEEDDDLKPEEFSEIMRGFNWTHAKLDAGNQLLAKIAEAQGAEVDLDRLENEALARIEAIVADRTP